MLSHFGNLGFLGGMQMQRHPIFGMQPQGMPVHYPGAFNPQGGQFPMMQQFPMQQAPMQMQPQMQPQQGPMPVQGTMERYPLMSGMMPGRINLGALGQSQMMRTPQAY